MPQLAPERIRAALPRLSIERRRPYQVLAEPDWAGFLDAARGPLAYAHPEAGATSHAAMSSDREPPGTSATPEREAVGAEPAARARPQSPWGTPRTARQRLVTRLPEGGDAAAEAVQKPPLRRSRAGLTGEHTAQRDHALLALALATGLRAVELCALDLGDLTREWHEGREEWWLVLPDAKTKGQRGGRTLPLAANVSETLLAYVRATGRRWESADDRAAPLFLPHTRRRAAQVRGSAPSAPAGRLSTAQVRNIVDRVEAQWANGGSAAGAADRRAHVPLISPHALRHSTAVALLEGNRESGRAPASVEHVRSWLGHIDIRTTQGYLAHVDTRRHRRPFTVKLNTDAVPGRQEDQAPAPRPDEAT